MSESAAVTVLLAVLALLLAGYAFHWGIRMLVSFTRFVMDLHVVVILLLFVLFPPALLAFLAGMVLIKVRGEAV